MHRQEDAPAQDIAITDETIAALLLKNSLVKRIRVGKHAYTVGTRLKANHAKWYYCSLVRYKGKEIVGDSKLRKVECCRKRAMQSSKTKILWDCFVKEAAAAHLEKIEEINARRDKEFNKKKRSRNVFFPVLIGTAVIVATVYGQYQLDPKLKRGVSAQREPHSLTEQPTDASAPKEVKNKKGAKNPVLRASEKPEDDAKSSRSLPDPLPPAPLPVALEIVNVQRAPDIPDPPEETMAAPLRLQTEVPKVAETQQVDRDTSINEKAPIASEALPEPQAVTKEAPQSITGTGIEEAAQSPSFPGTESFRDQREKEPTELQEAIQTTQTGSLENQDQALPKPQPAEPEIQRVKEKEAPAAEKSSQAVIEDEKQGQPETPSKEEIRKKINALLENSNN